MKFLRLKQLSMNCIKINWTFRKNNILSTVIITFLGNLAVTQSSYAQGMSFSIDYIGNVLGNFSGPATNGTSYTQELDVGLSANLTSDWSVVVTGAWTYGEALSVKHICEIGDLQGTYNDANAF